MIDCVEEAMSYIHPSTSPEGKNIQILFKLFKWRNTGTHWPVVKHDLHNTLYTLC